MSAKTPMTVEQFAALETGDTEDFELVEGELVPLASATPRHGKTRGRMEFSVLGYFERNPAGDAFAEVDCRIGDYTVRRPDLSIFLGNRAKEIDPDRVPAPFAPDIAVEVLTPSESAIDVNRKVLEYLAAGSQEVWVLDGANREIIIRTATGIRLLRDKDILESPLLPGFSLAVADLLPPTRFPIE